MSNWMNEKKEMEIRLTNDDGGMMLIKTKCSINEVLDRVFFWMDRGWYLDVPEMIKRGA